MLNTVLQQTLLVMMAEDEWVRAELAADSSLYQGYCKLQLRLMRTFGDPGVACAQAISRSFSRSSFARPYICRFTCFRRLMWPSVGPFDHSSVSPAFTAS